MQVNEKQVLALRSLAVTKAAVEKWEPRNEVGARDGPENTVLVEGLIMDSEGDELWQAMGFDVQTSPGNVRAQLADRCTAGEDIVVEIDSPGGSFFAGATIGSLLAGWKGKVTARIRGIAASAAGNIALYAGEREMDDQAVLMMHGVWGVQIGNAADMEKTAGVMRQLDETQVNKLVAGSNLTPAKARAAIEAETWWTQAEAIRDGIATAMARDKEKEEAQASAQASARVRAMLATSRQSMLATLGGP